MPRHHRPNKEDRAAFRKIAKHRGLKQQQLLEVANADASLSPLKINNILCCSSPNPGCISEASALDVIRRCLGFDSFDALCEAAAKIPDRVKSQKPPRQSTAGEHFIPLELQRALIKICHHYGIVSSDFKGSDLTAQISLRLGRETAQKHIDYITGVVAEIYKGPLLRDDDSIIAYSKTIYDPKAVVSLSNEDQDLVRKLKNNINSSIKDFVETHGFFGMRIIDIEKSKRVTLRQLFLYLEGLETELGEPNKFDYIREKYRDEVKLPLVLEREWKKQQVAQVARG